MGTFVRVVNAPQHLGIDPSSFQHYCPGTKTGEFEALLDQSTWLTYGYPLVRGIHGRFVLDSILLERTGNDIIWIYLSIYQPSQSQPPTVKCQLIPEMCKSVMV